MIEPSRDESAEAAEEPSTSEALPPTAVPGRRYDAEQLLRSIPMAPTSRAVQGWRRWLRLRPSRDEMEQRRDAEAVCTGFGRPVSFVVANPKGGAGKTPVTLLLSGAFGATRGGGVLAWDNNELRGTMNLRSEQHGCRATVRDLLLAVPRLVPDQVRHGDLSSYVRHQVAGQFDVLAATSSTYEPITREEFIAAHAVLSRFYPIVGLDTGNAESAPNWIAALEYADALVVPVKWKWDVCMPAIQMLDELEQYGEWAGDLVRRVVVVASNGAGDVDPGTKAKMKPFFEQHSAALIEIPTDPHIAAAGPIVYDQLAAGTRSRALRAAAAVARSIQSSSERKLP